MKERRLPFNSDSIFQDEKLNQIVNVFVCLKQNQKEVQSTFQILREILCSVIDQYHIEFKLYSIFDAENIISDVQFTYGQNFEDSPSLFFYNEIFCFQIKNEVFILFLSTKEYIKEGFRKYFTDLMNSKLLNELEELKLERNKSRDEHGALSKTVASLRKQLIEQGSEIKKLRKERTE